MELLDVMITWNCECGEELGISMDHLKKTQNGVECIGCNNCKTLFIIKGSVVIHQLDVKLELDH